MADPNPVTSSSLFGGVLNRLGGGGGGPIILDGQPFGSFPTLPPPGGSGFTTPTGGGLPGSGSGVFPGQSLVCSLAGLPADCSALDLINAGVDAFAGGGEPDAPDLPNLPGPGFGDPGTGNGNGCGPGAILIAGQCVAPGDVFPGGDPFMVPAGATPVRGLYGAGFTPTVESRQVRSCPPGFVLGKDNVCYDRLPRSRRKWDPGMKPLLTGGDRAAIRKAAAAGRKLHRSKKMLKQAERALAKVS